MSEAVEKCRKLWEKEEDVNRATAVYEAQESVRTELEARYKAEIAVVKEVTTVMDQARAIWPNSSTLSRMKEQFLEQFIETVIKLNLKTKLCWLDWPISGLHEEV